MMSFEDADKLNDITVYLDDCAGIPHAIVTDGPTMKSLRKRAESLCEKDIEAAKQCYRKPTKSCKKTWPELMKLWDTAQIGIQKAIHELQSWSNAWLYWFVLRRVLYDIPIPGMPGRLGAHVGGGVKLPGQHVFAMHGV
jgi:hypothetical protein